MTVARNWMPWALQSRSRTPMLSHRVSAGLGSASRFGTLCLPHIQNIDGLRCRMVCGLPLFFTRKDCHAYGYSKMVHAQKGFGFIQPTEGGNDVFVHASALERAGISNLAEGQKVSYEIVADMRGKSSAERLELT